MSLSSNSSRPVRSHFAVEDHQFTADRSALEATAQRAIAGSMQARAVSRATRFRRSLQALQERFHAGPAVNRCDRDCMMMEILATVMVGAAAPLGTLHLYDRSSHALHLRADAGFGPAFTDFFSQINPPHGYCGVAFTTGQIQLIENVAAEPFHALFGREAMLAAGAIATQSAALMTGDHKWGVVSVHYSTPEILPDDEENFALAIPFLSQAVAQVMRDSG